MDVDVESEGRWPEESLTASRKETRSLPTALHLFVLQKKVLFTLPMAFCILQLPGEMLALVHPPCSSLIPLILCPVVCNVISQLLPSAFHFGAGDSPSLS